MTPVENTPYIPLPIEEPQSPSAVYEAEEDSDAEELLTELINLGF